MKTIYLLSLLALITLCFSCSSSDDDEPEFYLAYTIDGVQHVETHGRFVLHPSGDGFHFIRRGTQGGVEMELHNVNANFPKFSMIHFFPYSDRAGNPDIDSAYSYIHHGFYYETERVGHVLTGTFHGPLERRAVDAPYLQLSSGRFRIDLRWLGLE